MIHDAFETLGALGINRKAGARLYTCEHTSNRVPRPFRPRPSDRRLLAMHWGYDIGAANVTRALVQRDPGSWAVLSRFSRLLIDPNRDPADPTAILCACDDGAPTFNRSAGPGHSAEHHVTDGRVRRFHEPFHEALVSAVSAGPRVLISVHSFTPVFRGQVRAMEAGVLFDQHDDLALRLVETMRAAGFRTEANEPYSGKAGLIYSAARHGGGARIPYLEIELRQDLIASSRSASKVAARIGRALDAAGL